MHENRVTSGFLIEKTFGRMYREFLRSAGDFDRIF